MKFKSELKKYPNGDKYYDLFYGDIRIGHAKIVDGGFLTVGRRKPVLTLKDAAKQLLDRSMNNCMNEHERLRKILGKVLSDT